MDKIRYAKYSKNKKGEVLIDGHTMFTNDIVRDLNRKSFLEAEYAKQKEIETKKSDADEMLDWIDENEGEIDHDSTGFVFCKGIHVLHKADNIRDLMKQAMKESK